MHIYVYLESSMTKRKTFTWDSSVALLSPTYFLHTVFENILSKLNPRNLPLFPPLKYGLLSKNSLSRSFNTQVILQHETSSNNYTKFYNTWRNKFWWLTPIKTLQKPNLYKYNWQGQSNMTCRGGTGENL